MIHRLGLESAAPWLGSAGEVRHAIASMARPVGSYFAATLFARTASFAGNLLVARALGPTEYGTFALALVLGNAVAQILDLGLHSTAVRFGAQPTPDARAVLQYIFRVRTVTGGLLLCLSAAAWVTGVFGTPRAPLVPILAGLAYGVGLLWWNFCTAIFQTTDSLGRISSHMALQALVGIAGIAVGVACGLANARYMLVVYAAAPYFSIAASWRPVRMVVSTGQEISPSLRAVVWRFGGWLSLSTIACFVASRSDLYVLSQLVSRKEVGIYAGALQLVSPLQMVGNSLAVVAFSKVSRARSSAQLRRYLRYSYLAPVACLGSAAVLMAVTARWVTAILGPAYSESSGVLQVLPAIPVANTTANLASYVALRLNDPRTPTVINLLQALASPLLCVVMVPFLGLAGAAWSMALVAMSGAILIIVVLRNRLSGTESGVPDA